METLRLKKLIKKTALKFLNTLVGQLWVKSNLFLLNIPLLICFLRIFQGLLDSNLRYGVYNKFVWAIFVTISGLFVVGFILNMFFVLLMIYKRKVSTIIFFLFALQFLIIFPSSRIENNRKIKRVIARYYSIKTVGGEVNHYINKTDSYQPDNEKWVNGLLSDLEQGKRTRIYPDLFSFSLNEKMSVRDSNQIAQDTVVLFERPLPSSTKIESLEKIKASNEDFILLWRKDSKIIRYVPHKDEYFLTNH